MRARLLAIASNDSSDRVTVAPSRATRTTSSKVTGPTPTTTVSVLMIVSQFLEEMLARTHHIADEWHTWAIRQMNVGWCIEPDEVCAPPDGEHPDVVAAQRRRSAGGGGPQRLCRREIHVPDPDGDAERHARRER